MKPRFRGVRTLDLYPEVRGVIYRWPEELEPTPPMPPLGDFNWFDFDYETQVRLDCRAAAEALLDVLPKRARAVVVMRVYMDMTLDDVGERLGVTRERIRQIEAKAMRVMRTAIRVHGIDGVIHNRRSNA